ncbi:MAG: hypothetical protein K0S45_4179, partial [Nitrospira sp.]|nr:hypothetical protein [Nitrospira sp.]
DIICGNPELTEAMKEVGTIAGPRAAGDVIDRAVGRDSRLQARGGDGGG